ncbi:LysR family transcriptional regulator [Rouxiella sp. T17]|uniref:LysR family transcriptional regulator n=1 Tax=Rouxiella sp. T17 TaxID=3085684 RepID=UPI002FC60ED1
MDNIENLTAMVVFARVVETLSFTEAANTLRMSKSSVSREIASLEVRLGAQLLTRTTRKIAVTDVGLRYYQFCNRILNEIKGAEHFIRHFHEEPIGNLRLTAPVTFGCQCVVPVLNHFINNNIHVNVDLDLTDRPVNMADELYDLAIVITRDKPDTTQLKPLIPITWGLYAAPNYVARLAKIDHPEDLPRHDYILFRGPAHTISLPFYKDKQKLDIDVRSRFRVNNSVALMSSAIAGGGIAYLPDYIAQESVKEGKLVQLLPDWKMDTYHSWVLFKSENMLSARVRLFVDDLERKLRQTYFR